MIVDAPTASDGVGVHRLTGGGGPLVVAVHGAEGSWREWQPLAAAWPGRHRLVALDLPWRAGNDYGWELRGTPGQWLGDAVDRLGEPVHAVLGHSLGGNAVLEWLCAPRGHEPAAAVLFAPFYRPVTDTVDAALEREFRAAFRVAVADGIRIALSTRAQRPDEQLFESIVDTALNRVGEHGLGVLFRQFVATGAFDLAGVRVPARVLVGETDPALIARRGAALAAAMPTAAVSYRPDYGHCFHISHADRIAAELAAFLADATPVPLGTGE
ncbi:alpha/beta fold hydrolase [Streptomyces sp. NPDC093065]|uniref:alpha/beta fold hydrolase n=1 Tax=Streptomyces sp. NPDC093065 TaxID=3366021 RepID=UPI0038280409